jgi:hypothetical protein
MNTNCCLTDSDIPAVGRAQKYTKWQYMAALLCAQKGLADLLTANASGQVLAPDGTALTVKRTFANIAASTTDGALVTAVTGKKIRVLGYTLHAGDTAGSEVTLNTKPVGAGTAITSLKNLSANQQMVYPQNEDGWFETTTGQGLTVTTGAGSTTGIDLVYVEI